MLMLLSTKASEAMNQVEAKVGMRVYFGRANGEQTLGEIIKVNRATLKIKQLESRGMYRTYPVGTVWTVPVSLCAVVDGVSVNKLALPHRTLTEKELIAQERRNEARAARAEAAFERRANR